MYNWYTDPAVVLRDVDLMALPEFDAKGDLPVAIHRATLDEVVARFGQSPARRREVTSRLVKVLETARATGKLSRLIIYGSYVTAKTEPRDVDILLVLDDDFVVETLDHDQQALFDHERAEHEMGASVFWVRPSLLLLQTLDEFIEGWQLKRDKTRRGIVEVIL